MDITTLITIAPFDWVSIGAAILCGSIIGLERQLKGKPVGIRTSSLIVLGTHTFIIAAQTVDAGAADPTRIIGQVVTGIGFLGAGVMLSKEGIVIGVTSAATIWVLAAIGVCLTVMGPNVAIKLSVLVFFILFGMDLIEDYFSSFKRGVHKTLSTWRKGG